MTNPYTQHPLDAFMAAETSVAMAMTAVLLFKRAWPALTRALLFAALFVAVSAPVTGELVHGLGYDWPADRYLTLLDVAAALATLAMVPASPKWLLGIALLGEYWLYRGTHFFVDQALALSALHVAWIGGLFGFLILAEEPPREPAQSSLERSYLVDDLALAAVATVLAAVVGTVVLKRQCDSADEWATRPSAPSGCSRKTADSSRSTCRAGRSSWRRSLPRACSGSQVRARSGCSWSASRVSRAGPRPPPWKPAPRTRSARFASRGCSQVPSSS
jgi:hypothetical protein